ncbi:hypothetical protein BZA05DRAFT_16288 [Tricharina praecox]|uniref:uncharacterized protein n=1 Tax=Tricharina praecox TaxID=43433 RepID=UPI002221041C|nr:uncharacterized protein BZA05DRAFT_243941 [Tricharina praecox]XP_051344489.1 uncharacterized protein BZA05DRAFT_16288 [Tricharina praecox]KAI5840628.1 hypothetical protein BZA05DRAFT_243941 [Tricharina praecox]KAI5858889.1 hypothetical protein BZA05DRAFT_16288 [Tricharina praecox]
MHASTLLLAILPSLATAHMAMWHPSVLDFNGDGYTAVTPLSGKSFSQWWFHGMASASMPSEVFSLPVGKSVTVEASCNKDFTSWGSQGDGQNACPDDTPSLHAGTPVEAGQLLGCGLAIAYKSKFTDVKPEDFAVFSVNHQCVKQLKTTFDVPKVMPKCPDGGCICAWFWQGQSSADEMYMTGFRCNISGGSSTASISSPKAPKYCPSGGCVSGPKQPMYWANDNSNIAYSGDYYQKPSYNAKWGFANGAQNDIVSVGKGSPTASTTLATVTRKPSVTNTSKFAIPTKVVDNCTWKDHCAGATCVC